MSTDYFEGVPIEAIDDMTKAGIQNLNKMRIRFRRHPEVMAMMDEQVLLLQAHAAQARAVQNITFQVRAGTLSDMVAAIMVGSVSRSAKESHDQIVLNGRIITMMLRNKALNTQVEA
jgi:hypothetical protein